MSYRKWGSDLYQDLVRTGCSCFVLVSRFKARSWHVSLKIAPSETVIWIQWCREDWFNCHLWATDVRTSCLLSMYAHFRSFSQYFSQFYIPSVRENNVMVSGEDNTNASLNKMCFLASTELGPTPDTRVLKAVTHVQAHQWLLFIELDVKSSSSDRRWASRELWNRLCLVWKISKHSMSKFTQEKALWEPEQVTSCSFYHFSIQKLQQSICELCDEEQVSGLLDEI